MQLILGFWLFFKSIKEDIKGIPLNYRLSSSFAVCLQRTLCITAFRNPGDTVQLLDIAQRERRREKRERREREREEREERETPAATFSPSRLDVAGWGALSEPKKNFGFPEAAARRSAALSAVVLATGLQ